MWCCSRMEYTYVPVTNIDEIKKKKKKGKKLKNKPKGKKVVLKIFKSKLKRRRRTRMDNFTTFYRWYLVF